MKLDRTKDRQRRWVVLVWLCVPCATACGDEVEAVGVHSGVPGATTSVAEQMATEAATASEDATAPSSEVSDRVPALRDGPEGTSFLADAGRAGAEAPDSGALSRGLVVDELAAALQRHWLVEEWISNCGDLYRYERFAAPAAFTRIVFSSPACVTGYPSGSSEYSGTYKLSGRRLSVIQTDIVLEEQYDIAIEATATGLVQHPGVYLPQSETAWMRQTTRERRDAEGARQWRIARSVALDFGAPLPLDEDVPCTVSVNVELTLEGVEPEGEFLLGFGPYPCTIEQAAAEQVLRLPPPTAEELSGLDMLVSDTVQNDWHTWLRLPRPNAEYIVPAIGYREITESDIRR